jgi:hypothetical protein
VNKAQALKYKIQRRIFSKVFENTLLTIILTVVITFLLSKYLEEILSNWSYILLIILVVYIIWKISSYERTIKKAELNEINLKQEWKNNEIRTNIPSNATVHKDEEALYLKFIDIPFTLNQTLPSNYAFEFKSKILNQCFSWCTNATITSESMKAYMFQYNSIKKRLRPHFLSGYEKNKKLALWVTPELKNSPLISINRLELKERNGWYYIRTEVRESEKTIKLSDLDQAIIKDMFKTYKDSGGKEVKFNRDNKNRVVEIKIFDMYDLGKNIYHNYFLEPPFKCFLGGNVGFRNSNFESALYKDIVVKILK